VTCYDDAVEFLNTLRGQIERAQGNPSLVVLTKLAETLGLDVYELLRPTRR